METTREGSITYSEGWSDDNDFYQRQMTATILPLLPEDIFILKYGDEQTRADLIKRKAIPIHSIHMDAADIMVNHPDVVRRSKVIWSHMEQWLARTILSALKEAK